MSENSKSVNIRVRDYGQTYHASGGGKRASCSASEHMAAERLAQKLAGDNFWRLERTGPRRWVLTILGESGGSSHETG